MFLIRYIAKSLQRCKYLLSSSLCFSVVLWIYLKPSENLKSSVNLKYVTVHFDLKGSPPRLSYLESLLPMLNMYGVNSVLMEYEDMFPYWGSIVNISSKNCYSKDELKRFITKAKMLNIEIIPLIQTFGHMEFVLKLNEFAHLREHNNFPADICPSNPSSQTLLFTMLQQIIEFHIRIQPLKHIHVGCDEVKKINICSICTDRSLETITLFVKHVEELTSMVKKLSPRTKVLIWGDMFYDIKKPERFAIDNVDVVPWEYKDYPTFLHKYYYNLHTNFKEIWIATAYKGAEYQNAIIPDIRTRFRNHLSWMKFILNYRFGGETKIYNFKGIILTGWSRFSHMQPQCELLPIAMPSLVLNLLLIKTFKEGIDYANLKNMNDCQIFDKYLRVEFNKMFQSKNTTDNNKCSFEDTFPYPALDIVSNTILLQNCSRNLYQHELKCHGTAKVDMDALENSLEICKRALKKISNLKISLETFMNKYYETHAIDSYVNEVIQTPSKEVMNLIKYLQNCFYARIYNKVVFV